ncbi:hypothetical protein ACKWTF_001705 [Chironomus riparius]
MSNSVKVKIINFREPDEIYIKFLEGEKSCNKQESIKVKQIERNLVRLCRNAPKIDFPKFGEIYGCYIGIWKKWIRGKVISKHSSNEYNVFCIDHAQYKKNITKIVNISDELKCENTMSYYKVSLGLKPLNMDRWSLNIIDICRAFIQKENVEVHFVPFFEESDLFIGDLFILDDGSNFSMSEKLISLGLASKPSTDFNKIFNMLHDKEIGPLKTIQPKKRLQIYKSQSETPEKESKPNLKLPNNLILHGSELKSFWNSINESGFHNFLKKKFSYKNEHLNDIQKVIWPQIADGKHSFIISSNQDCLTSIYILPLINKLLTRANGDNLGPIAIIFANNSSRIDEIVKKCEDYVNQNISIVKAVGICKNKQIDLMNGCDILVTTPPAFIRLVQNTSYKIIDENILNHVVFDNFDQNSLNLFDKELNALTKFLYASKVPQTITVSRTNSNGLKTKILSRLSTVDTVICMDNYLDAAAFVGLSISIEIAGSQDKIHKLTETDLNSYKKNVIVVSEIETLSILKEKLAEKATKSDDAKIDQILDESILTINDIILNDSIIQNADNLIHYDLPFNLCSAITTSDQFSKRFKVFHNEIYKRLSSQEKETTALRTKIILSDDNVSQFEVLINFLIGRNLMKASEKVIEKIFVKNEAAKCINKASLCQNLTQFGDCKTFNCVNRHKLSEQDKPPIHLEIFKNFITFDLISLQGPTTFVIKIREYYDNKWISCVQSNEHIQQKLDVDMQRYCNEKSNALTLNEGKVGEIYAKKDNKLGKWIRGRMIKRRSRPIVELSLLDYAPDIPSSLQPLSALCSEETLVKLPEEFTKLDPLLFKLQIMNLIPLDGEKSYSTNDINEFNKSMTKIPRNSKLFAKIETVIGDVMFSKNIEAKNDNKAVIFRLTEAHSKLGISEIDETVYKRILELSSALNVNNKEDPVQNIQDEDLVTEKSIIKPVEPLKCWKQLKQDMTYPIIVKEYFSPYSFFVIIINQENLTLKNNLKTIEESQDHKQLISININECCLLNSNNRYLRAVILNILADGQIQVLLVDYGEIQKCDDKSLFEIPKEFLNLNFQAVHCSMLGICPKFNMKFWPSLQRTLIQKLIFKYNEKSLKMLVVKDDQKQHQFSGIGVRSYNVMLYHDESKSYLSKLAVKEGIASECVEYNGEFYKSTSENEDNESLMDTSMCCNDISNDTEEELYMSKLLEMIKMSQSESAVDENDSADSGNVLSNNSREFVSSISAESTYSMSNESSESREILSTNSTESMINISSTGTASSSTSLKSIFKLPYIEWRQNEIMIYLLISANDCTEYALSINETSLDVSIKYQNNKIERSIIQLYGSVKPKFCSHELAGLKIIVKLPKKFCGLGWPRLTMSKEKSIYIKFGDNMPFLNLDSDDSQENYATNISDDEENDKDIKNFGLNVSTDDEDFY